MGLPPFRVGRYRSNRGVQLPRWSLSGNYVGASVVVVVVVGHKCCPLAESRLVGEGFGMVEVVGKI